MTTDDEHEDHGEHMDPLGARRRLPREIAPGRDLWPSIHRRIAREATTVPSGATAYPGFWRRIETLFRTPSWGLVGATAVVACILGAGVMRLVSTDAKVDPPGTPASSLAALTVTLDSLEHECARVQADVLELLATSEGVPGDATRDVLLANLAIIESAVAESRAALSAHPDDPHLAELALAAYRDRLAFLRGASRIPFDAASDTRS